MTNPNEDQDWLDVLAGKSNLNADPEVTRRATLLRQAIQRHDAALGVNDFDVEAGLQKLMLRLKREGLSGVDQPLTIKERFAQLAGIVSAVLAICSILFIAIIPVQMGVATRGMGDRQIVLAVDPDVRVSQLTTELDRLGIKYQIDRKEGKILLKAQGVDPVKDDVASFLERNHIKPPVGVVVELEIRSMAKP